MSNGLNGRWRRGSAGVIAGASTSSRSSTPTLLNESVNLWNDAGSQQLRAELTERLARAMLAGADERPYPTALA